jgi:uncharacterized protein involved in exopolysaccharide biosynthesis
MTDQDSRQNTISVRELALLTWEHRRLLSAITAACGGLGLLIALLLPNQYTADTELLPPQQNQSMGSMLASQVANMMPLLSGGASGGLGLKDPNAIYLGMLQSPAVEDPIISQFNLLSVYGRKRMSSARKKLEKRSEIRSTKEGMIRIAVDDSDSKRAAAIANAYVDQLRRVSASLAVTEAGRRRIFFEQQVKDTREQLVQAEQHMTEMQQKTGLIQLAGQGVAAIQETAQVRGEIAAQQIRLKALLSYTTENFPEVVTLKEEIAGLQSHLTELEKKPGAGNGDIQLSTGQLPSVGLEYIRAARDVRYYETVFELLAKQLEIAKLDEAREGGLIQVLYPAVEPDKPSFPSRGLIVALFLLLGFLGGIFWIAARELYLEPGKRRLADSAAVPVPSGVGHS